MTQEDFNNIVRGASFFQGLETQDVENFIQIAVLKRFQPGQVIFNRGDPGNAIYVLVEGKVRIFVSGNGTKEQLLRVLMPGDSFGEAGIFLEHGYPSTSQSLDKSAAFYFPADRLRRLVNEHSDLAGNFLKILALKLADFAHLFESRTIKEAPARLASFILNREEVSGRVKLNFSKGQLASFIGTSPETVSRALTFLKGKKAIMEEKPYIVILNRDILNSLVQGTLKGSL
ncbi:MAG: Crp/Fnr family transcriptional regulator [Deltaproteobacteria bacterium]|jgi:CRP/FNR family transcriptional regulator|nr:Crp/Fnr family transcriptional regulator [Deltaproteobacteria bacterium]